MTATKPTPNEVIVFLGPSLPRRRATSLLDARYLPPVGQGDVFRALADRPRAIAIIDGYFESVPAVWHKEILHAISEGVTVFGSSSMGALRAAELHPFGMIGVGEVFTDFRDGRLEDDDEVAVIHGPAELGYPALNEAMVNIRATIARAVDEKVVCEAAGEALTALAKAMPYRERDLGALVAVAGQRSDTAAAANALGGWLPSGRVDRKGRDAETLLTTIGDWLAEGAPTTPPRFHFERTTLYRSIVESPPPPQTPSTTDEEAHR